MTGRPYALQGRANVECPECRMALSLHSGGECPKIPDPPKLWVVRAEVVMVVVADSEREAKAIGDEHAEEEAQNGNLVASVRRVYSAGDVPRGWMGATPYGGSDQFTSVREILEDSR